MPDAYLIDVASILETLGGSIEIADDLDVPTLQVGTEVFTPTGQAHVNATVTNTGGAIVAMGTVSVPVETTCVRCLTSFELALGGEIDGFYVFHGRDTDLPEEQEVEYIDSENRVDILPAIMSALVLGAPFAPLHDEACRGICPNCGQDLNEGECTCHTPDPHQTGPFGGLSSLLDSLDDSDSRR